MYKQLNAKEMLIHITINSEDELQKGTFRYLY